jgi:uncharacterized membrane protein
MTDRYGDDEPKGQGARLWMVALVWLALLSTLIHYISVCAVPHITMGQMLEVMGRSGTNVTRYAARADETTRTGELPAPDLLYATCVFDVSSKPLRIEAKVPDSYWSMALYSETGDLFLVANDTTSKDRVVRVILGSSKRDVPDGYRFVQAPSPTGVVVFRTLIDTEAKLDDLRYAQRDLTCAPGG